MKIMESLVKKIRTLNDNKKYRKVIELLNDTLLSKNDNAQLYAEKAFALHKFNEWELCKDVYKKSLALDPSNARANYCKSSFYFHSKQYKKATKCLNQAIRKNPKHTGLYKALGFIYNYTKEFDKAIKIYSRALKIEPNNPLLINALGDSFRDSKQFAKAEKEYKAAINIDNNYAYPYNGLGDINSREKKYNNAVKCYNKAIDIDPNLIEPYYNRALVYNSQKKYKESLCDFEKYLNLKKLKAEQLTLDKNTESNKIVGYYSSYAELKIKRLRKIIQNPDYSKINELVNKIKALLLFDNKFITHYTSLSVAKFLILDDSPFRISEGAFLNDTSEGRELFNYLNFPTSTQNENNNTIAKPFSRKPFIGSFVPDSKHDDLTLWRMYGKENKEEGKGCAITLDLNELSKVLDDTLIAKDERFTSLKSDEDFNFYRVAYKLQNAKGFFIVPDLQLNKQNSLNKLMETLKIEIENFKKLKNDSISLEVLELLNEIAFLFKSADYQYEHEIRLVVNGEGINKKILTTDNSLKAYIELQIVNPYIEKVTLGPKVERADEWAATFYYSLEKQDYFPKILISHLPFK